MTREQAKTIRLNVTYRDVMLAAPNIAVKYDEPTVVSPIYKSDDGYDLTMRPAVAKRNRTCYLPIRDRRRFRRLSGLFAIWRLPSSAAIFVGMPTSMSVSAPCAIALRL